MLKGFRDFAMKGNVLDLAVGIVIGGAFGKIVSSFVSDILMPPLGLLLGKVDFSNLFLNLSGKPAATLAEAKAAGLPTLNYGLFFSTVVDFLIVALAIYVVIQQIQKLKAAPEAAAPTTKECPFCCTAIPLQARRCGACTSELTSGV